VWLSRVETHIRKRWEKGFLCNLSKRLLKLVVGKEDKQFTGINGGQKLTTGFARNTVMGVADTVISAVNLELSAFLPGGRM